MPLLVCRAVDHTIMPHVQHYMIVWMRDAIHVVVTSATFFFLKILKFLFPRLNSYIILNHCVHIYNANVGYSEEKSVDICCGAGFWHLETSGGSGIAY